MLLSEKLLKKMRYERERDRFHAPIVDTIGKKVGNYIDYPL